MVDVIRTISEWKNILQIKEYTLGFVPTMGALHLGHVSLIEKSMKENDKTIVSIFVNPTQFNDPNDLENYPKTWDEDLQKLQHAKVDYLFYPDYKSIYHDNYSYKIKEQEITNMLCGSHRPGHFDGVLTVVMKLLNIIAPDRAYFGKKDYQQYQLIKQMVAAFFMEVTIVGCEIIRENDGLAMSSRNLLLTPETRKKAPLFYKVLKDSCSCQVAAVELEKNGFIVDYIEEHWNRRFGAVFLDKIRLIDNIPLKGNS